MNWLCHFIFSQLFGILFFAFCIAILIILYAKYQCVRDLFQARPLENHDEKEKENKTCRNQGESEKEEPTCQNHEKNEKEDTNCDDVEMNQNICKLEKDVQIQRIASKQLDDLELKVKTTDKVSLYSSIAVEKQMKLSDTRRRKRLSNKKQLKKKAEESEEKSGKEDGGANARPGTKDKRAENPAYYEPADHNND